MSESESREAIEWLTDVLKAVLNEAGGEVLLRKETYNPNGRLEVTQSGDVTYVRCWKGMTSNE